MVETSIMLIGNTNTNIQINVSEFIDNLSFISVLWKYSCSDMQWRQNVYFSRIIISNSQIEGLVSYSRSLYINVNMCFPNSNFEGTLVLICLASHFYIECGKWIVGHRDL